ncbi:MAG: prolyl oligopeptidase family serine peptidase [Sphingomonas sp.]|nr:prolyl oligopeptidase family serine peptidase [Sphingomonas sp.]
MRLVLAAAAALVVTTPAMAEDLTLEAVFGSPSLDGPSPRAMKLSPDGTLLTMLRPREDDRERYDLWALDTSSGEWRMLVDSEEVGTGAELSEAEKMQRERARIGSLKGIVAYDWAPDGQSLLVPLDGDLYLAGRDGSVQRLTDTAEGELNPTISPKGGYVSFVRDRRLYVGALGEEPQPITPIEDNENVYWGEAEFVAQEEMDRDTGYWWSPNDDKIAVLRFDESPVQIVTRTSIGAESTSSFDQRYPLAGTENVLNELWIVTAVDGTRVKVDLGDETDIYIPRVDWSPDGQTLYVQRQNRAQTALDLFAVDPATGTAELLFTEKAAERHWINLTNNYRFLKNGGTLWWSERDGFGHLYLGGPGSWRQLTSGNWAVDELQGLDEHNSIVYFTGNKDGVLETHLYRLDYSNPDAQPVRLTELGYSHGVSMDKKATRAIITRSAPGQPPQHYLADTGGNRIAWIEENALDADHPYAPYLDSHEASRFGTIKTPDGTTLHYQMILPAGMEDGKRYPVFMQHYGGPLAQTVRNGWTGALRQWIVDQGYIFFQLDNRGSANRGVAFEQPLWRAMGGIEVRDQKLGADWLKTLDYVDANRIATYGWSYGGYMSLKMLAADPGTYAAAIAGAPVSKWELYDTHYTERYMGDPREVQDAYDAASTFDGFEKIEDPLLLIHGMSDDNVVLDNSTAMAAALQKEAIPFEMMLYPGQTHRVEGPGISVHLWTTIMDFLDANDVPGGPAE